MTSFAQYGPGKEELPVNIARGNLRRNATNDGWEEVLPENVLLDAATSIDINGQKIVNSGSPTPGSSDLATVLFAESIGVNSVLRAAYNTISNSFTIGTSQPHSLADSLFTGFSPGGSIAGAGVLGVVCVSFSSATPETGTGSGQAGLGSSPDANQPYNYTDFPGQHDVHVQFQKADGNPMLLQDVLSSPPGGQGGQEVEAYISYRSDLGANLKWRLWYYYKRTSDGYHVSFSPDIALTGVHVYVAIVGTLASVPIGFGLGKIASTPGATGVTAGILSDIQNIGTTASAGSSGRFSDAQHVHSHGQQPAGSQGGLAHNLASGTDNGFMSAAQYTKLDGLPSSAVSTSRDLVAGAGLTGGGDLSADRSFNVGANPDGSITVNADNIQIGVLATDAQHGVRGGGTQHSVATQSVAGFQSAADKTKLDNIASDSFNVTTQTVNATPFDIAAYTPADGKEVTIIASVSSRKSDGTAGSSYRIFGGFRRSGGTTTQIGTTKVIAFVQDAGFTADTTFSVSGSTINVRVTGVLATTIDWRAQGSVVIVP